MAVNEQRNSDLNHANELVIDAIVTQKLAPSQKVSENILSDMFDISRTVSRNLIERLLAQQFLVSLSPRVTQVAPLTLLDVKQNFALRKILLPEIAFFAATNIEFDKLDHLKNQIEDLLPIEDDDGALKVLKLNKELNLTIGKNAGYPLMLEWARQLEDMAMRVYWLYVKTHKKFPYSNEQQTSILNIMKTNDPAKIQKASFSMLSQTEEIILNAILSHDQFYTQDLKIC